MLAAVCFMHKTSGLNFARTHSILMLVLDGIRRQHVRLQRQAEPLTGRLLAEVLAGLDEGPIDLRDAARLSLLYAFALRASEVVALDWQQLGSGRGWVALAADRVKIVLLGSKACQQRAQHVAIPTAANPRMLAALRRWIDYAQIKSGEPLVRPLTRGGTIRGSRLDA